MCETDGAGVLRTLNRSNWRRHRCEKRNVIVRYAEALLEYKGAIRRLRGAARQIRHSQAARQGEIRNQYRTALTMLEETRRRAYELSARLAAA